MIHWSWLIPAAILGYEIGFWLARRRYLRAWLQSVLQGVDMAEERGIFTETEANRIRDRMGKGGKAHMKPRSANCRSCAAAIVWMWTKNSKKIPVNPDSLAPTDDHMTEFDPKRHVTHYATCPQSKSWRKK